MSHLWFTENVGKIGMINPTTHAVSEFATPTVGSAPFGITSGPDGNLWFTVQGNNGVGMINPTTHAISLYATDSMPYLITAGSDGNLWFTEPDAGKIVSINPTTYALNPITIPYANSSPRGVTTGPDGGLWFTERYSGQVGRLDPTTGAVVEYPIPYANAGGQGITTGPDGNLWFVDQGSNAIGVAALSTRQLAVTGRPPASITAGAPFGLTVEARDDLGNPDTSFNGTVTVAMANNTGGADLGGTLTATASNGVATFSDLTLTRAASGYTLLVSGGGLGEALSGAIDVSPAAASKLVVTQQPPARVTAGSGFGLTASIEDTYGNVVTSSTSTVSVSLASNPGGSTLGGTLTAAASNGVAAFSGLTLKAAASGYTLSVSGGGFSGATTGSITVVPAGATQLVIVQQPPTNVGVNTAFGLVLAIEDSYGNIVTSANNTVSVTFKNNPKGAKLGGTTSVKASNGYVTFSGLTINRAGSGDTLLVSGAGLTGGDDQRDQRDLSRDTRGSRTCRGSTPQARISVVDEDPRGRPRRPPVH